MSILESGIKAWDKLSKGGMNVINEAIRSGTAHSALKDVLKNGGEGVSKDVGNMMRNSTAGVKEDANRLQRTFTPGQRSKDLWKKKDFAGSAGAYMMQNGAGAAVAKGLVGSAAVGTGLRMVTGNGGLLKNGKGETDIAGIPFI